MENSADKIKASVAAFYRYGQQCPVIALEVDDWNGGRADLLAVNKRRYLIEVEVKTSFSDMLRDRKKNKHHWWLHGQHGRSYPPVHQFYFAVSEEMATRAVEIAKEYYPYAGVISSDGTGEYGVVIQLPAKQLLAEKLSIEQCYRMVRGQSATVCRLARDVAGIEKPG